MPRRVVAATRIGPVAPEHAPARDFYRQVPRGKFHLQILYRTVPGHENVDAKGRLGLAEVFPGIAPPKMLVVIARISQQQRVVNKQLAPDLSQIRFLTTHQRYFCRPEDHAFQSAHRLTGQRTIHCRRPVARPQTQSIVR